MADFEFTITEISVIIDLEEYINYLIIERYNEIYAKLISRDAEYQNLQLRIESSFQELLPALQEPAQKKIVTEMLWSIISILELLLPRITYRQAVKDGFRLKEWMKEG